MFMMQWSCPNIFNAVQGLARHLTVPSVSYSQNNKAKDHVLINDDVGCDFNNSCESALDQCGDLAIIGDKENTTDDSVAEDSASHVGNKKNPQRIAQAMDTHV
jgi:hypothetical protein